MVEARLLKVAFITWQLVKVKGITAEACVYANTHLLGRQRISVGLSPGETLVECYRDFKLW